MLPATDDAGPLRLVPPKGMAVRALDSNRGFVLEQRAHLATVLLEWVVLGGVLAYASWWQLVGNAEGATWRFRQSLLWVLVASLATIPVYIHRTFVPMRIYVTLTHIEVGGWFGKRRICIDDVRHPYVATRVIKRLWLSPYSIRVWWFGPAVPHVDVQLRDDEVERGVFVGSEADAEFVCSFLSESMGWASKQRRAKASAATGRT